MKHLYKVKEAIQINQQIRLDKKERQRQLQLITDFELE
jgi:hypothetical protein